MTTVFALVLVLLAVHYAGALGAFAGGFRRVVGQTPRAAVSDPPRVSVVIPARNEAASIGACVEAVLANDYPADRFEVIVVDDDSADATVPIVEQLQARFNGVLAPLGDGENGDEKDADDEARLRLVRVGAATRARAHKKHALTRGVAAARGDLVLTTDADCLVPPGWIRTMAACFEDDVGFVSGPVLYRLGPAPFARLQALEFLGLVAIGAGAIGVGRPNLCNGANVAYRRALFEAVGGYAGIDHVTSGDDELLMQKIARTTAWRVRFCAARAAVVVTEPAETVAAFVAQRRRWASKGPRYPSPALVAMLAAIYGFYVALLAGTLLLPVVPALGPAVGAAWALKLVAEAAVLVPAASHFQRRRLIPYLLVGQLLYVPYVVFIAPAGALSGYTWKDRPVDR